MIIILFFIPLIGFSQAVTDAFDLPAERRCTSNDLDVVSANLDLETCDCEIGETVYVPLNLGVINNTNSFRTSYAFWARLTITHPDDSEDVYFISGCDADILPGNQLPDRTKIINTDELDNPLTVLQYDEASDSYLPAEDPEGNLITSIPYVCGSTLNLANIFQAWTDASDNAARQCPLESSRIAPKCGVEPSLTVGVGLSAEEETTDVTCNDEDGSSNDGSVTLTFSGGKPPYFVNFNGGDFIETISPAVFSNLSGDTYQWVVRDSETPVCVKNGSSIVGLPDPFSADATGTNLTCSDEDGPSDDGTATANLTNGIAPFSYLWDDGSAQTTVTATGLAAGTYNVVVTDFTGCKAYASYEVTSPDPFSADATGTNLTCNDEDGPSDDGTATANLTNGIAPFSYLWDDGSAQTTVTATGLAAGTYNVVVTDFTGCKAYASYEVTSPDPFSADATGTNLTCSDEDGPSDDGTATANLTNGIAPFSYLWDDGSAQTTVTATGLAAGTYNVVVTDFTGCKAYASYEVTSPDPFSADATGTNLTCNDEDGPSDDGTATANLTNGIAPFSYLWDDGSAQTTVTATGLAAGTYNVVVTDFTGCKAYASYEVTSPDPFSADATGTNLTCNDEDGPSDDGTATANLTNGIAPFSYLWDDGSAQTTVTATGLAAGTYNVVVTDFTGCKSYASYEVLLPDELTLSLDKQFEPTCKDAFNGSIEVSIGGGVASYDLVLKRFDVIHDTKENVAAGTHTFSDLGGGTYEVVLTDDSGCINSEKLIILDEPLEILGDPTPGAETCLTSDGTISLEVSGGTLPYTYAWEMLEDVNFSSTDQNLSNLIAGTYKCTITDKNGCIGVVQDVLVEAPINCSHLFPTQTDCSDYLYCDKDSFVQEYMCATIKKVKGIDQVTNVIPGALFYYGDFSVSQAMVNTPMIVELQQEAPVGFKFMLFVNNSNVRIYQNGCQVATIRKVTTRVENGKYYVKAEFTPEIAGTHVFSVKLDPKSVIGSTGFTRDDGNFQTNSYLMGMIVDGSPLGVSFGSLGMNTDRRCSDPAIFDRGTCNYPSNSIADALQSETLKASILVEEPSFSVAPVPFTDQLSLRYDFEYTSDVKIQFFDLNGSLLRTYADKQVTRGDETSISIDFALKANQVYIIRVETDRDTFSKTVMSGN
ncbi:hypothetical protein [Christiangramia forsetii]|nr:hypothetical protein [Christiangramia forsetii]